jgi:uncharacterized membrane protein YhhN
VIPAPVGASVFTAVCLAGLLAAESRASAAGRWLAKPLASAGFLGVALAAGAIGTSYGSTILVALALCWLGDMLLIPASKAIFQLGLGAFLLGHVTFAAAFVREGVDWRSAAGAGVALAAVAILVGRWLLPHVDQKMRPPVIAYICVITAMVALAVGTFVLHRRPLLLAGAIAFYLSDLSVARDTFVKKEFLNRLWGLPMYYGAQLLFAWSVA